MRVSSLLAAGALALSGLIASAPLAVAADAPEQAAATFEVQYAQSGTLENDCPGSQNTYVLGCFVPSTSNFWLRDQESDGQRVAVYWWLGDGTRTGLCINTAGAVSDTVPGELKICNNAFARGKWVNFKSGRCDGDVSACNRLAHYHNWTFTRGFQVT